MKIEAIKNVNITVLFSSPINHLLIGQQGLLELFKTGDQQIDPHTFVEAPGLKVLMFTNRKKDFVFEGTRILVNDKNEVLPKDSEIIDDFEKIINSDMVEQGKVAAYGFNYDVIITPESGNFQITDLVGSKIANIQDIKSAGVNILFEKNSTTYVLEIKPIGSGNEQKFVAHFNAHFSTNELPVVDELKSKIAKEFAEFKTIIEQI